MHRRTFIGSALACVVGVSLPAQVVHARVAPTDWFRDAESARALGHLYLRQHPDEGRTEVLMAALFPGETPGGRSWCATEIASLRARCRQDFLDGDLVLIDGWYVARTEARLFALFALHPA